MNIRLIKKLDAVIGDFITSFLPSPAAAKPIFPLTSILLIRPGGIGDAVLLAPVIRSLKIKYPAIHITILAEQRNVGVFLLMPAVDRLLCYDRPGELIQALRYRYDVVVDTEQSHHLSAVVARIISATVKVGFDTNQRRRMFTQLIPYSQDQYEVDSFVKLIQPLGIASEHIERTAAFLSIPLTVSTRAADLLKDLHGQPFVVIFPGASIPERRWGAEYFRQVAEMLAVRGIKIVIVGGKEDRQQGDEIAGAELGLNLAGLTTLEETAAVIQKSCVLLSGDSGVLHIAVGLGIPTVSLFGPGRAKKWAPQVGRHIVLNNELPCSPCTTFGTTPHCSINVRCMQDISVEEVANAVISQLS